MRLVKINVAIGQVASDCGLDDIIPKVGDVGRRRGSAKTIWVNECCTEAVCRTKIFKPARYAKYLVDRLCTYGQP
jgi:hypothetical protein